MVRLVERIKPDGKKEFGVRYDDGHIKWEPSMPHARYAYAKAVAEKRPTVPWRKRKTF